MAEPFVPDNVAPDLAPLYNWLAPDPDRQYGTFWPKSFYPAGSPAWVQNGPDARWAMPAILRDALAGALDLANSTYSGAITNRGIGTLLSNGAGAGGALAEKGALAAGGGRWWNRSNISLPMDEASRAARAAALGFDPNRLLFHGTYKPDFDAFRILHPALAAREGKPPGVWAAENPAVADNFAVPLPRSPQGSVIPTSQPPGFPEGPARIYPLVARFQKRGNINLSPTDNWPDIWRTIAGAFNSGYDAIRTTNYTNFPELGPQTNWVFREPNQLRSPFAVFDPAKRDSSDLLAARTSIPGFRPIPTTPGFRPQPNDPAGLPAYLRMMKKEQEEREY